MNDKCVADAGVPNMLDVVQVGVDVVLGMPCSGGKLSLFSVTSII